jgi:hypothetical protein
MKNYLVTIVLIIGYYDKENTEPKLKSVEYKVNSDKPGNTIYIAKNTLDKSSYSVWESYAEEI